MFGRFDGLRGPRVGGLYSVRFDDRGFAVAKVLVVERGAVHVRLYANRYADRPVAIAAGELGLGPARDFSDAALNATHPHQRADPGPMGIGHLPLRRETWSGWAPRLIATAPVGPDELDGYETWRQARGGYF